MQENNRRMRTIAKRLNKQLCSNTLSETEDNCTNNH